MSDEPYVSAIDVLRVAVASGLPGAQPPPTEAHRRLTFDVLAQAENHRVQGLVWSALERGDVVASDDVREKAHEDLVAALRRTLMAESWGYDALAALDRASVETRALKGLAIAHLDHPAAAERVFGDADLLVRRSDLARALTALAAVGFQRFGAPPRGWWERRYGKSVVLLHPNGGEVDLHLAITGGYFGAATDHASLWATASEPFDLGGRPTLGLDREGRLLQACYHMVLGGGSGLRAERDVAQLILVSGADWARLVGLATRWGTELAVAEAVRGVWADLRLDDQHPAAQWARGARGTRPQATALAGYRAARRSGWGAEGRSTLLALGPVDRVRFLAGLAVPSRASRGFQRRSVRQHISRGLRVMRPRRMERET